MHERTDHSIMAGPFRISFILSILLGLLAVGITFLCQGAARADESVPTRAEVVAVTVTIDIKPGSYPNSINLRCRGVIPVAILTTESFDATTVDPETVVFAGAMPLHHAIEDVDWDQDMDLILHFACQDIDIDPADTEACLQASTYGGVTIEGCDSVRIVRSRSALGASAAGTSLSPPTPSPALTPTATFTAVPSSLPTALPSSGGGAGWWATGWPWSATALASIVALTATSLAWVYRSRR